MRAGVMKFCGMWFLRFLGEVIEVYGSCDVIFEKSRVEKSRYAHLLHNNDMKCR